MKKPPYLCIRNQKTKQYENKHNYRQSKAGY